MTAEADTTIFPALDKTEGRTVVQFDSQPSPGHYVPKAACITARLQWLRFKSEIVGHASPIFMVSSANAKASLASAANKRRPAISIWKKRFAIEMSVSIRCGR